MLFLAQRVQFNCCWSRIWKTRVLTTRLNSYHKSKKAWPNQILCVTFTNKAAKEMQNRVMQYVKGIQTQCHG